MTPADLIEILAVESERNGNPDTAALIRLIVPPFLDLLDDVFVILPKTVPAVMWHPSVHEKTDDGKTIYEPPWIEIGGKRIEVRSPG